MNPENHYRALPRRLLGRAGAGATTKALVAVLGWRRGGGGHVAGPLVNFVCQLDEANPFWAPTQKAAERQKDCDACERFEAGVCRGPVPYDVKKSALAALEKLTNNTSAFRPRKYLDQVLREFLDPVEKAAAKGHSWKKIAETLSDAGITITGQQLARSVKRLKEEGQK